MQKTQNLNLNKPDYTDVADIADLNANMDILDEAMANHKHNAVEIAANTDLDDIEDEGYYWCTSSNASSVTNKPDGITFFSLRVSKISGGVFSQEITTAWNRKFIRIHWSGDWSEWVKFSTDDHTHSLTDQDITGILPVSKGGTGATSAEEARANLGLGNVQEALNGRLPFGICTTSGNVQTKTVMIPEYTVTDGSWFLLKFTEDNTWTSSVFLSVNGQSGDVYFGSPDSTSGQFSDISADTLYLVYFNEGDVTFYFTDLSVEITPKEGSTSLITSGAVFSGLAGKAAASHGHALADLPKGTDGYILTAKGTTAAPAWEKPLIKAGTGQYSAIIDTYGVLSPKATGQGAFAAGLDVEASGNRSVAFGDSSIAAGEDSMAVNNKSEASGNWSFSAGYETTASGTSSATFGYGTEAKDYQFVTGKFNVISDGATSQLGATGDIFIVGVGTGESARANAFRITTSGDCYGKSSFKASGADFAEFFEWVDGNPDDEDRRGLFVTLEGEKIRLANSDDKYILGAVSAVPTITGDTHSETWKNMYLTDVFGTPLTETIEVDETTNEQGDVIPAHTEIRFIVNPEYDNEQKYISRDKRKEWAAVGLVGKLVVADDGSCIANGFCKVADGGVATKSDTGYRVLTRLDDTHIKILIR